MNKSIFNVLAMLLILGILVSCSSDDEDSKPSMKIKKEKVTGISQKGPFVAGSKVTLYELDPSMQKTGRTFSGTTNGDGKFEIEINDELVSPYVILEVKGKYKNELDNGSESDEPITLKAIASVKNKNIVNINALTNLEYKRVLELVSKGKTFEDAKAQAQKEALNKFGIPESSKNSEDLTLGDKEVFEVSTITVIYSGSTNELISLLEEAERINSKVENSTIDIDDLRSLFNKARDYILSLYPIANFPTFDDLEITIEKIKAGGISDWPGDGCDFGLYCFESRGISGALVCEMAGSGSMGGISIGTPLASCPKPKRDNYCFQGSACQAIGTDCSNLFLPASDADCKNNGGKPGLTRKDCEAHPDVGAIFSCNR